MLDAVAGDEAVAREAVLSMFDSYEARTDRELRHVALSLAFSLGAMDSLARSAARDLAINLVLRLRSNANALNRAANQAEMRLDKQRRQPESEPEVDLPASCQTDDLLVFARGATTPPSTPASAAAPAYASRQQRRHAERQAEKQRERAARDMLLAERKARLANPVEGRLSR